MINLIIYWSLKNRGIVLIATAILILMGFFAVKQIPIDALPDLSDVQVIIRTNVPGQAPQVVEDQVTYPITTAMLSVPGAEIVRGYSFFGDSFVYIIFEDGTDLYWARSRVLEYLSQITANLPAGINPQLGPDATGVGWVFEYALIDKTGKHDLAELTSLQNWFLKYELQTVSGVSEVATLGGMVKQYQVVIDPNKLRSYSLPLATVHQAIRDGNMESGGSVLEIAEAEYMVRSTGYIQSKEDLRNIPLFVTDQGTPILLSDVAEIRLGPQMRRGVVELNGEGETVGGIIVMRFGENALDTIDAVKKKLSELQRSLPQGVEIITTYDRSDLIQRAVSNLNLKLFEEFLVVALVCGLFLFHFRSAWVVILSLPIGILSAFSVMQWQGINANIMSLGGIAIAIGAMVDAAIVMIENVHKHLEENAKRNEFDRIEHWTLIYNASKEVGPPLFFSLLIITLSFLPVFTLEAQEGRLFSPLAYTKTYAMAAAAGLAITLVPVLMGYFIRGKVIAEHANPINRGLIALYKPIIHVVLTHSKLTLIFAGFVLVIGLWPLTKIGSEFMPPLDEGDMMYMPTMRPGISIGKARQVLQQTDRLIKQFPEVAQVFGKVGRADTATDPAPLTMIETLIKLKPKEQWRQGMTADKIRKELNQIINLTGVTNAFVMPIKTRIDMLATGIKTPVGIKVSGPDLKVIQKIGKQLEKIVSQVAGTASVYAERTAGGRYITVDIDRKRAARYGLNIKDVQNVVRTAVGGMNVTQTTEGLERYPVNLRYPQVYRDSLEALQSLPIVTRSGGQVALADVADISIDEGAPVIKSENARLNGWVYVDIENRDIGSYVEEAQQVVAEQLILPTGYSIIWSGQYEYMQRAKEKLKVVVPLTLLIILLLLYINFRKVSDVLVIICSLPMALAGGVWLVYLMEFNLSVAVGVGFIALAGVSVEIGVLMLVYLNQALVKQKCLAVHDKREFDLNDLKTAILQGALMRIRPIMMTVAAIIAGLIPIMFGDGTGSEVMQRIAAPMIGGMVSATLLVLLVIPAMYYLINRYKIV